MNGKPASFLGIGSIFELCSILLSAVGTHTYLIRPISAWNQGEALDHTKHADARDRLTDDCHGQFSHHHVNVDNVAHNSGEYFPIHDPLQNLSIYRHFGVETPYCGQSCAWKPRT